MVQRALGEAHSREPAHATRASDVCCRRPNCSAQRGPHCAKVQSSEDLSKTKTRSNLDRDRVVLTRFETVFHILCR